MKSKNSCERFLKSIEDTKWIIEHFASIKKKYKGEFIAVLSFKIVAHHKKIDILMDIIEKKFPEDVEFVTTEFIGEKEVKVIL